MNFLVRAWYRRAPWLHLLMPASWLFGLLASRRRQQYVSGRRAVYSAGMPVIVVGNISVGGTGKTPLVIALANAMLAAGHRPGIVSRGYGGHTESYPMTVTGDSTPAEVGDEALMIARNTDCPVVIDPQRPRAVKSLASNFHCDLIISDDGLQHYALKRDIEIAVIDGRRGLGNGFLLPAGPLRESPRRLEAVDFIVINGANRTALSLAAHSMTLQPVQLCRVATNECRPVDFLSGQVHAVAGIGNPVRFFDSLSDAGFAIIEHVFADHHCFRARDIRFDDDLPVIMTEKDAVKCRDLADERHWYLKVRAEIPAALIDQLQSRLLDIKQPA